jgi:putative ABC transport system permease protein
MKSVTKSFRSINVLMSFVGLLIAAVTIFIVIYIDILNRKRQIGILRAIGIHAWIIRATYVLQSSVYALAGVIFGSAIFFAAIVPYFAAHPFSLPLCDAVLVINPLDFSVRAETVVLLAIVSGLIPTVLVTRMQILDAVIGK